MRDLVDNGAVCIQRLAVYKALEDKVRGDRNEGLAMRFDGRNPGLRVSATIGTRTISLRRSSLVLHGLERDHGVYCMYGLLCSGSSGVLRGEMLIPIARDRRIREGFGDTLVIFPDTKKFVRRLAIAAQAAGIGLRGSPIEYVPMDYCGDVGPFRKLETYRYQSEYRFVTTGPIPDEKLILTLGSLEDIAMCIDLSEVPLERESAG